MYVSRNKIAVSYIFKNHSNVDITTLVAFPMPSYTVDLSQSAYRPDYDDFTVEVNDKPIRYSEEMKAIVDGIDYTDVLENLSISIKYFGNKDFDDPQTKYLEKVNYFSKLSQAQREMLLQKKLVVMDQSLPVPNWEVSRKYYWTQAFPANSETKIKHTYKPYPSFGIFLQEHRSENNKKACIDKEGDQWMSSPGHASMHNYSSVEYILTTANNWRQPIKDFRLILDGAKSEEVLEEEVLVTTCFPGDKKKIGQNQYEIRLADFLPKENLTVYFIEKDLIPKLDPSRLELPIGRKLSAFGYGVPIAVIVAFFGLAFIAYRLITRSKGRKGSG